MQDVLEAFWGYKMSTVYTAMPCTVLTVHAGLQTQMVDVQPLVNRKFMDEDAIEHPPILGVPLMFPSSKTSAFTFPISVGDVVLCVFSQRGTDNFKQGAGSPETPLDFRKFDKRDAIAIPGLFPFKMAVNNPAKHTLSHSTADAVLVHNLGTAAEAELRIKPDGKIVITTPSEITVNAATAVVNAPTSTFNGNVVVSGNVNVSGTLTAATDVLGGGISLKTHTHTDTPGTGAGTTSPPN